MAQSVPERTSGAPPGAVVSVLPDSGGCPREPCDDLLDGGVGPLLDLGRSPILDRVWNEHRLQVGPPQAACLHPGGGAELVRGQGHGGNPVLFESNAVVQTARCAGASVSQGFDHSVHEREPLQQGSGSRLRVRRLDLANDVRNAVPLLEDLL